jgi:amylovoran biosynthesis glycosyltransferase AmsD
MKKTLLFVINGMTGSGGSERVVANLANIFSSKYKIYVLPLYGTTSFFDLNKEINFIPVEENIHDSLFKRGCLLVKKINFINPDTVIGISINKFNLFLSICSFFFKSEINLIASDHISFNSSSIFVKKLKKILYKRYNYVVLLTNSDRKIYQQLGFKNALTIPNMSSFFPNDVSSILKRDKIILAVGRIAYQKGFDRLLNIWSKIYLDYPDWKLLIIGEGEDYLKLKETTEQYSNFNCCIIPFTTEISKFYSNSQIYVMTSRFEGLPMVLIEAMSYGCPIISYDCETGPRDIVVNNENGFLVENSNEKAFIEQLTTLMNSGIIREKFHQSALISRERFHQNNVIDKWISII